MKGIILAGGTGSRLYPLTKVTNKHLLPVGHYPMIYHPLYRMRQAGIRDVMIVTGVEHMGAIVGLLGSGSGYGVQITYRVQDQAGGIAQALYLARDFAQYDRSLVILGDNIFSASLEDPVREYMKQPSGAYLLLKEVPDPQRFGAAELRDGRVVGIEEKPAHPKSSYCVTGIYMYDPRVFGIIEGLRPSGRGELEITDVNNAYVATGELRYSIMEGWWSDAGTFESLLRANELAKDMVFDSSFAEHGARRLVAASRDMPR